MRCAAPMMACPASAPTRSAAPCMRPGTAGRGVRDRRGRAPAQALRPGHRRRSGRRGEKGLIERAYTLGAALGLEVWCEGEAGPFQAVPQPGGSWRPRGHPAARVCPGWHLQGPDPVPSRDGTGAPPAGQQLHQPDPAWLAQGAARVILAALPAPAAPPDAAAPRAAWEAWQDGLAERFTLPAELPPLRMLLVWDNLAGHKTAEMVVWLCQHGVMPLYTPLGGSWLNMAESIQRILKRRTLDGQHPRSPAEIGAWFQQTAEAWNRQPTPFLWNGKRRQRRRKQRGDAHALGGSGAHTRKPLSPRGRSSQEWHSPRQVTH